MTKLKVPKEIEKYDSIYLHLIGTFATILPLDLFWAPVATKQWGQILKFYKHFLLQFF